MTVEERLGKLERELAIAKRYDRRLLTIVALTVGGMGLVWTLTKTMSAAYAQETEAIPKIVSVPKVVHANKFVLEDENGKPRAELSFNKDGPLLSLWDENGKPRAMLSGSGLKLWDENGKTRVFLDVLKDMTVLSLRDENGKVVWEAPR
jgi:hypothetical protein